MQTKVLKEKMNKFVELARKTTNFNSLPAATQQHFDDWAINVFCFNELWKRPICTRVVDYYLCAIIH